ncbi:MAG: hypothetical protein ACRD1Z_19430, partial [Vicinamibacteria bacterium]
RARGVRFFALGPEHSLASWYEDGPSGEPEFLELEEKNCEEALRKLWEMQHLPELAALAGPLLELASQLETAEKESGDVSPFIYVMY